MKYIYIVLFALLTTGCNRSKYIEFTGNMAGINNGIIVIKDLSGTQLCNANIFDGKFQFRQFLPVSGYYNLYITPDITKDNKKEVYDVYLEPGTYTISAAADKLDVYPTIRSTSVMQNELTDFYTLSTGRLHDAQAKIDSLNDILTGKNAPAVYSDEYTALITKITTDTKNLGNIQAAAFEEYVNKHPENYVEAHILSGIDYKKDPASYYRIFQKFTATERSSSDGVAEAGDLSILGKLGPGSLAPNLIGKTPDGKTFDPKSVAGKIILVEFWRSDNEVSRTNHQQLVNDYASPVNNKDFAAVSISLDTKPELWNNAIKEDKLTWTQLNDLKGESSPNMTNWSVTTIPTYDLLDGSWHIIKRDIPFAEVEPDANDYLKAH